ncbi:hypothetical protein HA402_011335 [Bradysia odoriphaga]|nr:hypothetical protein HA402_011335 [Bradysia odoriphaga]
MTDKVVKIARSATANAVAFDVDEDGSIRLSYLRSIYPGVSGLTFQNDNGICHAVNYARGRFYPPNGGWSDRKYTCVFKITQQGADQQQANPQLELIIARALGFFIPKSWSHQKTD